MKVVIKCHLPANTTDNDEIFKALSRGIEQYFIDETNYAFFANITHPLDPEEYFLYLLRLLLALPDEIEIEINLPEGSEVFKTIQKWLSSDPRKTLVAVAPDAAHTLNMSANSARDQRIQLKSFIENAIITSLQTEDAANEDPSNRLTKIKKDLAEQLSLEGVANEFIDYCDFNYYFELAKHYDIKANYKKAKEFYQEAFKVCDKYSTRSLWKAAKIRTQEAQAKILERNGEFNEALIAARIIQAQLEELYGKNSFVFLETEYNMLECKRMLGDQSIVVAYDPFLKKTQEWFGDDHPRTAAALFLQGEYYCAQCNYTLAEMLYSRAKTILEKNGKTKSLQYAELLNSLGVAKGSQKKDDDALIYLRESLAINTAMLGEYHPQCAPNLNNIATILMSQKKNDEVLAMLNKAFGIIKNVYGEEHYSNAHMLYKLGHFSLLQGNIADAIEQLQRALTIVESKLGRDHLFVANLLFSLACVHYNQKDYAEVIRLLPRVLQIRRDKLPADHEEIKKAENLLTRAQKQLPQATLNLNLLSDVYGNFSGRNNNGGKYNATVHKPPRA